MPSIIEESKKSKRLGWLGIFKNKKFLAGAALGLAGLAGVYFYLGGEDEAQTTAAAIKNWAVKRGDIEISIETDGKVVAESGVDLSFSVSGDNLEVEEVYVKEGQIIKKGDKIAAVSTDTLEYSVRSAYASYQSALASYNEKMDGATAEEKQKAEEAITAAEISLEQSRSSLESTKQSEADKILAAERAVEDAEEDLETNQDILTSEDVQDAYEDLSDTIKSTSISLDSIIKSSDTIIGVDNTTINDDFESYLGAENSSSFGSAVTSYKAAKNAAAALEPLAIALDRHSDYERVDAAAAVAETALLALEIHLYNLKIMLEATITGPELSETALNGHLATVASNRTSVNTKISALNTAVKAVNTAKDNLDDYVTDYDDAVRDLTNAKAAAERTIKTAESNITNKEIALEQARRSFEDLVAPLTAAELASARSQLAAASISLEKAQLELKKATILSPIDGQVAQLNYKKGDIIIDDTKSVATVINKDTLYIEVNIEEADISKIEVGDKALASFDALDGAEIPGEISFISLTSSTNNSGIVTYLVRVLLDNSEKKEIREGMTAEVKFVTAGVADVLTVPVAAVR
ncbi:MAG: HlyD family efflux transporter periplasmic adaptor subunit, partial [Planctomycetes bacterium]|nr:HlyD family efflux transporter periplasmic adaptor subunit [Planctomycetota bacterium]